MLPFGIDPPIDAINLLFLNDLLLDRNEKVNENSIHKQNNSTIFIISI